jgi:hypothetical protein
VSKENNGKVCRFTFDEKVDTNEIEKYVTLAFIAAESWYGKPKARMEGGFFKSDDGLKVVTECSTEVGELISAVCLGYFTTFIGEDNFELKTIIKAGEPNDSNT